MAKPEVCSVNPELYLPLRHALRLLPQHSESILLRADEVIR
jgi:hypothetical protein